MAFRSKRTFRLCRGHLETLKPRKKIFKIGFSWMRERPWLSASDRGKNCSSDFVFIFVSTTGRPVRKADKLNAICEPIVYKKNVGASTSHNPMGLHCLLQE
jgi:hypothetical protein